MLKDREVLKMAPCLDAQHQVGKLRSTAWEERSWGETQSSRFSSRSTRNWPCEGGQFLREVQKGIKSFH